MSELPSLGAGAPASPALAVPDPPSAGVVVVVALEERAEPSAGSAPALTRPARRARAARKSATDAAAVRRQR
jgi:hypothetical protein